MPPPPPSSSSAKVAVQGAAADAAGIAAYDDSAKRRRLDDASAQAAATASYRAHQQHAHQHEPASRRPHAHDSGRRGSSLSPPPSHAYASSSLGPSRSHHSGLQPLPSAGSGTTSASDSRSPLPSAGATPGSAGAFPNAPSPTTSLARRRGDVAQAKASRLHIHTGSSPSAGATATFPSHAQQQQSALPPTLPPIESAREQSSSGTASSLYPPLPQQHGDRGGLYHHGSSHYSQGYPSARSAPPYKVTFGDDAALPPIHPSNADRHGGPSPYHSRSRAGAGTAGQDPYASSQAHQGRSGYYQDGSSTPTTYARGTTGGSSRYDDNAGTLPASSRAAGPPASTAGAGVASASRGGVPGRTGPSQNGAPTNGGPSASSSFPPGFVPHTATLPSPAYHTMRAQQHQAGLAHQIYGSRAAGGNNGVGPSASSSGTHGTERGDGAGGAGAGTHGPAIPRTAGLVPPRTAQPLPEHLGGLPPSAKSSFLSLFASFYDSLSDSRTLKATLEDQVRRSNALLATLQRSREVLEEVVERRVGEVRRELGAKVRELEDRVRVLEGRSPLPPAPPALGVNGASGSGMDVDGDDNATLAGRADGANVTSSPDKSAATLSNAIPAPLNASAPGPAEQVKEALHGVLSAAAEEEAEVDQLMSDGGPGPDEDGGGASSTAGGANASKRTATRTTAAPAARKGGGVAKTAGSAAEATEKDKDHASSVGGSKADVAGNKTRAGGPASTAATQPAGSENSATVSASTKRTRRGTNTGPTPAATASTSASSTTPAAVATSER